MAKPSAREAHLRTPRVRFPDSLPPALRLDWTAWDDALGDAAEAHLESFGEDALETAVAPLAGVPCAAQRPLRRPRLDRWPN